MSQRKTFLLRISPELYAALEAWAQQEMRSVNSQMEYLLREAVLRRQRGRNMPISSATSGEPQQAPSPSAPMDTQNQSSSSSADTPSPLEPEPKLQSQPQQDFSKQMENGTRGA